MATVRTRPGLAVVVGRGDIIRFLATGFVPSFVKENPDLDEDPAVQALFS